MNNLWVIIWVSVFSKCEGVESHVYSDKELAEVDASKHNQHNNDRRFFVVEYRGKEHENAMHSREVAF